MRFGKIDHLAEILKIPESELQDVADQMDQECEVLLLCNPGDPTFKEREVRKMSSRLRVIQHRLHSRVLLPVAKPSSCSYGCVRGRHIKDNALAHSASKFALTCDISNFYPSIHHTRVYRYFSSTLGWHPDVARLVTRLCTADHHLALGLATSPIIANALIATVDARIASACGRIGLTYTRYVDDIAISGPFNLAQACAGVQATVASILASHGFALKRSKTDHGSLDDGFAITKIRVRRGRADVRKAYVDELVRRIDDARSLGRGGAFDGPYFTRSQINGQITFVSWINPGRHVALKRRFGNVDWWSAFEEAKSRGWLRSKKMAVPLPSARLIPRTELALDGAPVAL